jgi:hypothetical protein
MAGQRWGADKRGQGAQSGEGSKTKEPSIGSGEEGG